MGVFGQILHPVCMQVSRQRVINRPPAQPCNLCNLHWLPASGRQENGLDATETPRFPDSRQGLHQPAPVPPIKPASDWIARLLHGDKMPPKQPVVQKIPSPHLARERGPLACRKALFVR
jgi:hypothetical protein